MEQEQRRYLDELDVTPAAFIEKGEKRFSVRYRLSADEFLTFNRFIFENTAQLLKSRSRMRWMGICELLLSLIMLLVLVFTDSVEPLYVMLVVVMALAGALSMSYYPYIFPKQFRKHIAKSYAESGYADRDVAIDFYEDGIVDRTEGDAGALWEEFQSMYETETLFLLLLPQQQAVIATKKSLGDQADAFRQFVKEKMAERETGA